MRHREVFDSKVRDIKEATSKHCDKAEEYYKPIVVEELVSLVKIKELIEGLDKQEILLGGISIKFNVDSVKTLIDSEFNLKLSNINKTKDRMQLDLINKINSITSKMSKERAEENVLIRERNKKRVDEFEADKSKYTQVDMKKQRLLGYSQDILQLCSDYGIKISNIDIDNDMFTIEELSVFYDEFYDFISAHSARKNPITWIRDKVNDSTEFLLMLVIGVFIAAFTPVFDVVAIAFVAYLIYCQVSQDMIVKKYTIMAGLAFNVDPMSMCDNLVIDDSMLEVELNEEIDIDDTPELAEIYEKGMDAIMELNNESIQEDMSKADLEFINDRPAMELEVKEVIDKFNERRSNILNEMTSVKTALFDKQEEIKNKILKFGYGFSEEYILNTEFKLGLDEDTMIYETKDFGMNNLSVSNRGCTAAELDLFLKVMIINMFCNVRPGYMDCTVYDPDGMGRSLSMFYNPDLEQVFHITSDSFDKIVEDLTKYAQDMLKTTKGLTINDYNKMAVAEGRGILYYKLLIILSKEESIDESDVMQKFLEYSTDLGVLVWVVSNKEVHGTKFIRRVFDGIRKPISIDVNSFPEDFMARMLVKFKGLKSPALLWEDYNKQSFPEKDVWSFNADKFIDLNVGYEDGDRNKNNIYTLGHEGDVHGLIVGVTGAGKSVLINNLIINMCLKYNPNDLNLWLVDFKGNEFNFFLKKPSIGQEYSLPHIKSCLCTSDPDYAVSLFQGIERHTVNKAKRLMDLGYKDMNSYNKTMRKNGTPELCVPREIIIIDEFQVIFERATGKSIEIVKGVITYISKVARAFGMHLVLCSQSMSGTISGDVLNQFDLRIALRCKESVSMDIMKTKFASDIRERNGYLYVSSGLDKKLELQKKYRTPFIDGPVVREYINLIAKKAEDEGYIVKEPIAYEETTIHQLTELDDLYLEDLNGVDVNGRFILGERMVYSERGRRANIILDRENNQNIFSVFSVVTDAIMFFRTIMKNVEFHDDCKFIFNTQVKDLGYLLEMDEYLEDSNKMFYDEEMTPQTMITILEDILDMRRKVEDRSKQKPLYIILSGWDKAVGFGIGNDNRLVERYKRILQTCGVTNMHFIFICESQNEIDKSFILTFKHRIAGKCDTKSSNNLLDSELASKQYTEKDGYMFLNTNGSTERLKIYRSEIVREVKARELNI